MSLTFVDEEVGVAALELFGERASPPRRVDPDSGEAVPDVESFFLEVLESFALDNCSCTLCRKPFIFAIGSFPLHSKPFVVGRVPRGRPATLLFCCSQ